MPATICDKSKTAFLPHPGMKVSSILKHSQHACGFAASLMSMTFECKDSFAGTAFASMGKADLRKFMKRLKEVAKKTTKRVKVAALKRKAKKAQRKLKNAKKAK
jgi:hypothetical protein